MWKLQLLPLTRSLRRGGALSSSLVGVWIPARVCAPKIRSAVDVHVQHRACSRPMLFASRIHQGMQPVVPDSHLNRLNPCWSGREPPSTDVASRGPDAAAELWRSCGGARGTVQLATSPGPSPRPRTREPQLNLSSFRLAPRFARSLASRLGGRAEASPSRSAIRQPVRCARVSSGH